MFNGDKFIILLVVAVLVIGPERLPKYAEQLGHLAKRVRAFVQETKTRVDDELGADIKDVDWAALDPRKYDPRRIVREAFLDDVMPAVTGVKRAAAASSVVAAAPTDPNVEAGVAARTAGVRAPFDDEAT